MADIIMVSTDEYDNYNKVVLTKLNNPCHSKEAQEWFYNRRNAAQPTGVYHGAIVMTEEMAYETYQALVENPDISVQWE